MADSAAFEEVTERLHARGLRMTKERQILLRTLAAGHRALTPQELYEEALKVGPVGLTTTYRIIDALVETGFAQVLLIDGVPNYCMCNPSHHHHLVCTGCHRVEAFAACELDSAEIGDFHPTSHKIEIFGLCGACYQGGRS